MVYSFQLTAYELAMLDAACRACGLPLASALVKTANQLTAAHTSQSAVPSFSAELCTCYNMLFPGGQVTIPGTEGASVTASFPSRQKP